MALIQCKECGGMVSTEATTCPHCGAPVAAQAQPAATPAPQQTEPQAAPAPQQPRRHVRRVALVLAGVVALIMVLVLTCPSRQDHADTLNAELHQTFSSSLSKNNDANDPLLNPAGWATNLLGSGLSALVSQVVSTQLLQVTNYGVCSVGRLVVGKQSSVATLGIAGHVFTLFNKRDLQQAIDRYLNNAPAAPGSDLDEPDDAPDDVPTRPDDDDPDEDLDDQAV